MPSPCAPKRKYPYLPPNTRAIRALARQYTAPRIVDPYQSTAAPAGNDTVACPKCGASVQARELWRRSGEGHRC